jgi:hypothetical protein
VPDWEQSVRERLGELHLAPQVEDEIVAELAGHLEDTHGNFLEQGIGDEEAREQTSREISDGRELARKIHRAKQGEENMSNRARQFWLPALMTSLIGTGLLAVMQQWGIRPIVLRAPLESPATFYLPWLFALPFLGFLGAAWSRREGGTIRTRIIAGIFLSLIYFAVPWLFVPMAIVVDHETPHLVPFVWFLLNWAVVPCIALLIGALPAAFSVTKSGAATRSVA